MVWSRIDAESGKAIHLPFDRRILMDVTRTFAHEHGLELPSGYEHGGGAPQQTLYERAQAEETGLSRDDHAREVTQAWQMSDSPRAFVNALEHRGYLLATGNRPYVLVDIYGHPHALARLIDERSVRGRDLQDYLGAAFAPENLPTVEEAKKLMARFSDVRKAARAAEQYQDATKHQEREHANRRAPLEKQMAEQRARHIELQRSMQARQRDARQTQKDAFFAQMRARRLERVRREPKGLAAWLGKVSGVNALRRQIHRRQDRKSLEEFRTERRALREAQARERQALKDKQILEKREIERRTRALTKIENKERRTLERELAKQTRIKLRRGRARMPAIKREKGRDITEPGALTIQMNTASGMRTRARSRGDLRALFGAAAGADSKERGDDERQKEPGSARQEPERPRRQRRRRRRTRDPGHER